MSLPSVAFLFFSFHLFAYADVITFWQIAYSPMERSGLDRPVTDVKQAFKSLAG